MRSWVFRIVIIIGLTACAAPVFVIQESRANPHPQSGQISGQVRYAENGQPAFNVLVRCDSMISGSCGQETTDRSGRFRFAGLPLSQYTITVRVPGYIEQRQDVELLTAPTANLQFHLRSDGSAKPEATSSFVVDSNVPASAKKEFDQAAALVASGKKESLAESVRHLEKAVTIYPQFVQAQLMLGTAYMDLTQWQKAEQTLKRTVELDPRAANAYFALGELYLRQKKDEDAEKTFLQGLQIEDRSFQGHLSLARVYWSMASKIKDETQARPYLEKAYEQVNKSLALNADLAQAHLFKGNLYLRVRRAADAQHEFEEYLRIEPKGAFAEQARVTIDKIKKALESQPKP
ncbi:MAG TPA: carboxypeptidase regulatory-like domain-containing protein [Pyrinomonadaceae bacterium]|jgi:Tfp pilus assembly protein PilF